MFCKSNQIVLLLFFLSAVLLSQTILENQRDSLTLLIKQAEGKEKVDLLNELSGTLYRTDPQKALACADSALSLAKLIDYRKGQTTAIINNGSANFYLGNYAVTYAKYKEVYDQSSKEESPAEYSYIVYRLAIVQRKRGNFKEALKLAEESLAISKELSDTISIAKTYNVMGLIYWNLEKFDEAIKVNIETQKLVKDKYPARYAMSLTNMALVYYDLGGVRKAIELNLEALPIKEKRGDLKGIRNSYNNIALCYTELGEYETSLEYQFRALKLDKQMGNTMEMARAMDNIGKTYLDLNRPLDAKSYIEESYEFRKDQEDNYDLAEITKNMGILNYKLKNYKKANEYLQEALRISEACDCIEKHSNTYRHLSIMNKEQKNYKAALEYYVLYQTYQDSIVNENVRNQISELETKYESEKKEQEITLLNKDKELQAAALDNETLLRNSFIGAFIFAFILAGGLYNRYRFKNKANKELTIARERADEANQLKTELLGIAAHDLKNPLNSIVGFSRLLKNNIDNESTEMEYISTIEDSSEDMLNLINQLLNSAAIETGKVRLDVAPIDINSLSNKLIDEFNSHASLKKQQIVSNIIGERMVVNADVDRLREVMSNLVSNALKYSDYGKTIEVNLKKENDKAVFEVIDEGPGLTEDDKNKIFGKFQKLSAKPTGGESSTGLGLSIAKQLIELQNGTISVESRNGDGAKFIITLPLVNKKPVQYDNISPESVSTEQISFEPATLIIADDVGRNRKLIEEFIAEHNFTVFEATNGKKLVELANKVNPDLIFSDIKMPEMDGFEALRKMRENKILASVPIIAVTAEERQKVLDSGFNDYLKKPVSGSDIYSILKKNLSYTEKEVKTVESKLDDEMAGDIIDSQELLEKLKSDFLPRCKKLLTTLIIDEIEAFGQELAEIGNEYSSSFLQSYSQELLKHCKLFDIAGIKNSLNNFTELLKVSEKST